MPPSRGTSPSACPIRHRRHPPRLCLLRATTAPTTRAPARWSRVTTRAPCRVTMPPRARTTTVTTLQATTSVTTTAETRPATTPVTTTAAPAERAEVMTARPPVTTTAVPVAVTVEAAAVTTAAADPRTADRPAVAAPMTV